MFRSEKMTFLEHPLTKRVILALLLLLAGVGLWLVWEPLNELLSDPSGATLRVWVEQLGVWGPIAVVLLNIVQVLVAPLPGYPVIFVSGILYGGFWGAIYANLGIVLSGMIAAGLARLYGRPLVARFVEQTHLQRLDKLLKNDNPWLWFVVLILPTGDLPYFAAGLSRISMRNYFLALCAARLPFTFVLTYAVAETVNLPPETFLLLALPVLLLAGLGYWQQERISEWIGRLLEHLPPNPAAAHRPEPPEIQ
ncbi:MAG: TVP38/TMEM64 family protein [Ardenticatenaceae bacterium]